LEVGAVLFIAEFESPAMAEPGQGPLDDVAEPAQPAAVHLPSSGLTFRARQAAWFWRLP